MVKYWSPDESKWQNTIQRTKCWSSYLTIKMAKTVFVEGNEMMLNPIYSRFFRTYHLKFSHYICVKMCMYEGKGKTNKDGLNISNQG